MSVQTCLKFQDLPVVTLERFLASIATAANAAVGANGGETEASVEIVTNDGEKALDYMLLIGRSGWLVDNRAVTYSYDKAEYRFLISNSWDVEVPFLAPRPFFIRGASAPRLGSYRTIRRKASKNDAKQTKMTQLKIAQKIFATLAGEVVPGCETPGRPWLVGKRRDTWRAVVLQPPCKLWSCPYCSKRNALRWAARGLVGHKQLTESGKETYFLTLTHRGGMTAAKTRKRWLDCWPRLSARMRRASNEKPEYMYVHELHKSGLLHTHFISTDGLGARWWKDNPAYTGFGFMNDYQKCTDSPEAASYVSKYLAKNLDGPTWPKGWRRVGCSRGWPTFDEEESEELFEWDVCKKVFDLRVSVEALYLERYRIDVLDDVGKRDEIMSWIAPQAP